MASDELSVGFEEHRAHLMAVAYRMLGSRTEAEDAVQDAWLRYAAADRGQIIHPRAWLTTTTARICLDVLRSARVRREAYVGRWLPEPLVTRLPADDPGPAERAVLAEDVSYALLVVMERLSPEQRVALILHDVFAVPFEEIASVLSTTPAAARQLASRARRAVSGEGTPRHRADRAEQRRVVTAFLSAVESGDIDGLLAVLAPDVVAIGDGGGVAPAGRHPVTGAVRVARFMTGLFRRARKETGRAVLEPALINGEPGLLGEVTFPSGEVLRSAIAFAVAGGRITAIYQQVNPEKLGWVPAPLADRSALPPG